LRLLKFEEPEDVTDVVVSLVSKNEILEYYIKTLEVVSIIDTIDIIRAIGISRISDIIDIIRAIGIICITLSS
jgi:hypothetical protein